MRSAATEAAMLAAALLAAQAAPTGQTELRNELEQALGRPIRPPVVPSSLRPIVREAGSDRLVVRSLGGSDIVVDLHDREAQNLTQFGDGRFVGFGFVGYEFFGYTLIDRAAGGEQQIIATGEAPVFSRDGRYFAAASITEGGFGDLEGIALWEVRGDRAVRRFFTDALPRSFDWRVDGWPRADCVAISAIDLDWQPPEGQDYGEAARSAPRNQYQVEIDEDGLSLRSSVATQVCGVDQGE